MSQVKAIEAHGPASSSCLPVTKLILGYNVLARLKGWLRLEKLGVATLLALPFYRRYQDIPVVRRASYQQFPPVEHIML